MELIFHTKNQKQIDAAAYWIDDETEEILYGGAKGGGKSFLGATLIFADALIYDETNYFIARKELNDLRKFTIPTIHEVFKNWGLSFDDYATFNGQDNVFNLRNGSKVFLIACGEIPSDPLFERFGSMQMTRGWIEEAGEIAETAKANLSLAIGRWKNEEYQLKRKLLLTCNPKKGWLKRDYIIPFTQGLLPKNRKVVSALPTDNPYLSQEYVNALRNEKDPVRRQRLFFGDWDYDEDNDALISFNALTDTFSNTISKDGERYITADIARLGRDSTVLTLWEGLELVRIVKYQKQDTQTTIQKLRDMAAAERVPYSNIIIDADGIGGAVVDGLFGTRSFMAGSSPLPSLTEVRLRNEKLSGAPITKPNYANLKSQCAFKLAELINEHKIAFRVSEWRDTIMEELTALLRQRDIDKDGKLRIRAKDEVKLELGKSPDVGDALIFRAWFELSKAMTQDLHSPERKQAMERQRLHFIRKRDGAVDSAK